MEYALGGVHAISVGSLFRRLNPCCNGICSRRHSSTREHSLQQVLILVVMEYALGEHIRCIRGYI